MKREAVNILTDDSLLDLVRRCANDERYEAEVVLEKSGDAMSIRQSFLRNNTQLVHDNQIRSSYPIPGYHSGTLYFQNGSKIIFRGVRQPYLPEVHETLYQDKGRAGSYGRRIKKELDSKISADDSLYKLVELGDDDLLEFLSEFEIN